MPMFWYPALRRLKKNQLFASMSVRAGSADAVKPCCELLGSFIREDGRQDKQSAAYSLSVDEIARFRVFCFWHRAHGRRPG